MGWVDFAAKRVDYWALFTIFAALFRSIMNIPELYELFLASTGISTDSRNCPQGSIFFALKGDRFDGNDYLDQALDGGAAYVVADRERLTEGNGIIRVEDSLRALQELANYHRRQMKATVIAITGTNGKTTTKELTAAALGSQYEILYTEGNLNNHIGVPLTLLRLQPEHELAIIEMGANHRGEIAELCRIAQPEYGLITNVGKAHLEGFGSFEGVIGTKTELYDYLRETGGRVFANLGNPYLKKFYPFLSVIGYATEPDARSFVYGEADDEAAMLSLTWHKEQDEQHRLPTHLAGSYNLENALAAICIASWFGVDSERINRAIGEYIPQNNRSQNKKTDRNELIVDTYNANPSSMQAALENFSKLKVMNRMLILGGMQELGAYSREEHEKLVQTILRNPVDQVCLVGKEFQALDSIPSEWKVFGSTEELILFLDEDKPAGFTILIKGSRGNQLEKTIGHL